MAYFAKIEDGKVTGTMEADVVAMLSGMFGPPELFIEYTLDAKRLPIFGGTYRSDINEFIDPSPYPSWVLDLNNDWQPPTPKPNDGKNYRWFEEEVRWDEIISPV